MSGIIIGKSSRKSEYPQTLIGQLSARKSLWENVNCICD